MPSQLTEIERRILDYMVRYLRDNTYQPSIREIGEQFGIKSTKTVSEHLQALAEKGFLERDPSRSRGVRILGVDLHADTISIPCYRDIPDANGAWIDRAEMHLTLDRRLAGPKGGFFLRARGDALAVLDLREGDYLLVEPCLAAELSDGDIVIARAGERPSYYRAGRNGRGLTLEGLGPAGERILVEDATRLDIAGRVAGLYRRMDNAGATISLTAH
jgi:repressor LexA